MLCWALHENYDRRCRFFLLLEHHNERRRLIGHPQLKYIWVHAAHLVNPGHGVCLYSHPVPNEDDDIFCSTLIFLHLYHPLYFRCPLTPPELCIFIIKRYFSSRLFKNCLPSTSGTVLEYAAEASNKIWSHILDANFALVLLLQQFIISSRHGSNTLHWKWSWY